MRREEVIERFCILASKVGAHLEYHYPSDCFCSPRIPDGYYQFDERIMEFIESSVEGCIKGE
jgi:hypothetical protein